MKMPVAKTAGLVLTLVAALGVLLALPVSMGGSTTWVTTTGASMEPHFETGDLALVKPAEHYAVGDVVAYRSDSLDGVVALHRIVKRTDDGFVLKGDNNDWLDPDRPQQADILGKLWLHVPEGTHMLSILTSPYFIAAALVVLAGLGVAGSRHRRRRGTGRPDNQSRAIPRRRSAGNVTVGTEWAWAAGLSAVALAALAFSQPTHTQETDDNASTSVADLSYAADTNATNVYPDGRLSTGDPVFLRLAPTIDVRLTHRLTGLDGPTTGRVHAEAVVKTSNGWSSEIPLTPPQQFQGAEIEHQAQVDLRDALARVARAERAADASFGTRTLEATFVVEVDDPSTEGQPPTTFRPQLTFTLDEVQALPQDATLTNGKVRVTDSMTGSVTTANTIEVLRWSLPVTWLRIASILLGALALALTALAMRQVRRTGPRHHFAGRLVQADVDVTGQRVVSVAGAAELARVAELHDTVVLQSSTGFYVLTDPVTYAWFPRRQQLVDLPA